MRPEDMRVLREQLIGLFASYLEDLESQEVREEARTVYMNYKGQVAQLDEDVAKAVQLLEGIGYSESRVPVTRVKEALTALEAAHR